MAALRPTAPLLALASLLLLLVLIPGPAEAQQYFKKSELLGDMFPTADRVEPVTLDVTPADQRRARTDLGGRLPNDTYTLYRATTQGQTVGWCLFDDQLGQHEPITFGVQLDPAGTLVRIEVVVYREDRGAEIRSRRFRKQFEGKSGGDPIRLGSDIQAVSGATYSSRSATVVARRAVFLASLLAPENVADASEDSEP
jgi:Na+-translocating ferredoxin:NAD+ oxidoreductase subunit G